MERVTSSWKTIDFDHDEVGIAKRRFTRQRIRTRASRGASQNFGEGPVVDAGVLSKRTGRPSLADDSFELRELRRISSWSVEIPECALDPTMFRRKRRARLSPHRGLSTARERAPLLHLANLGVVDLLGRERCHFEAQR